MEDEVLTQTTQPEFACDKCDRSFKSAPALSMHKVRAHGKGWDTSQNFRKGKSKIFPSHTKEYQHSKYLEQKARYRARGLNAQGKPFKGKYGQRGLSNLEIAQQKRRAREARRKQRYVWPLPAQTNDTLDATPGIKHCPYCGHNIEKHL